jgi:transposase-like protein
MEAFLTCPLSHVAFPYVFCDPTYVMGRVHDVGRVPGAVVVATGLAKEMRKA